MLHRPQKTVACLALLLTPIPFLLPFSLPSVFSFFDDRVPPTLHFPLSKPGCIYTRLVSLALLHSSLSLPLYIASGFEKAIWQEETGGELGLAVQSKLGQSKTLIGRVSSLLSPHVSPPFLLVTLFSSRTRRSDFSKTNSSLRGTVIPV